MADESEASKALEQRFGHDVEVLSLFVQECQSCQMQAAPHWQFCSQCGSRLATARPQCGSPLPPLGARYCPHCSLELPQDLWPEAKAE